MRFKNNVNVNGDRRGGKIGEGGGEETSSEVKATKLFVKPDKRKTSDPKYLQSFIS